jgi:hypothetical protein
MIAIIGVKYADEFAVFGQLESAGEGSVGSLVFLGDEMDSRVFQGANDFDRFVLRAIVHDH